MGEGVNSRRISEAVPQLAMEKSGADQLQEAITQGKRRSSLLVGTDGKATDPAAQAALLIRRLQDDLVTASMRGDSAKIQSAVEQGAALQQKNARGVAPIMLVASSSSKTAIEAVKWIVGQSIDVNEQDGNGWSSLLHAARNGRQEMCEALMEMAADPGMKANDGTTAAHMAAIEGKKELMRRLIEGTRLYADPDQKGWTPLFYSCREGHAEAVDWLLSVNAKHNEKDMENKRPLMVASEAGHWKVCQILIKKSSAVDDRDMEERTALLFAVMNGHEVVACNLLKHEANPFVKSKLGESPGQIALEQGMNQFRGMLRGREEGFG
jgi:ankyrin repeat protein